MHRVTLSMKLKHGSVYASLTGLLACFLAGAPYSYGQEKKQTILDLKDVLILNGAVQRFIDELARASPKPEKEFSPSDINATENLSLLRATWRWENKGAEAPTTHTNTTDNHPETHGFEKAFTSTDNSGNSSPGGSQTAYQLLDVFRGVFANDMSLTNRLDRAFSSFNPLLYVNSITSDLVNLSGTENKGSVETPFLILNSHITMQTTSLLSNRSNALQDAVTNFLSLVNPSKHTGFSLFNDAYTADWGGQTNLQLTHQKIDIYNSRDESEFVAAERLHCIAKSLAQKVDFQTHYGILSYNCNGFVSDVLHLAKMHSDFFTNLGLGNQVRTQSPAEKFFPEVEARCNAYMNILQSTLENFEQGIPAPREHVAFLKKNKTDMSDPANIQIVISAARGKNPVNRKSLVEIFHNIERPHYKGWAGRYLNEAAFLGIDAEAAAWIVSTFQIEPSKAFEKLRQDPLQDTVFKEHLPEYTKQAESQKFAWLVSAFTGAIRNSQRRQWPKLSLFKKWKEDFWKDTEDFKIPGEGLNSAKAQAELVFITLGMDRTNPSREVFTDHRRRLLATLRLLRSDSYNLNSDLSTQGMFLGIQNDYKYKNIDLSKPEGLQTSYEYFHISELSELAFLKRLTQHTFALELSLESDDLRDAIWNLVSAYGIAEFLEILTGISEASAEEDLAKALEARIDPEIQAYILDSFFIRGQLLSKAETLRAYTLKVLFAFGDTVRNAAFFKLEHILALRDFSEIKEASLKKMIAESLLMCIKQCRTQDAKRAAWFVLEKNGVSYASIDPRYRGEFLELVRELDPGVRYWAIQNFNRQVTTLDVAREFEYILWIFRDEDLYRRAGIHTHTVANLFKPEHVALAPGLIESLKDANPEVFDLALSSLENIGEATIDLQLAALAKSDLVPKIEDWTRLGIVHCVTQIALKSAQPQTRIKVIAAFKAELQRDKNLQLRRKMIEAIALLDDR
jgi:hypothetical protein